MCTETLLKKTPPMQTRLPSQISNYQSQYESSLWPGIEELARDLVRIEASSDKVIYIDFEGLVRRYP